MSSDIGSDQNDEFALLERYLTQTDDLYSEPIVNMGEKYSGTQNAAFAPDNRVSLNGQHGAPSDPPTSQTTHSQPVVKQEPKDNFNAVAQSNPISASNLQRKGPSSGSQFDSPPQAPPVSSSIVSSPTLPTTFTGNSTITNTSTVSPIALNSNLTIPQTIVQPPLSMPTILHSSAPKPIIPQSTIVQPPVTFPGSGASLGSTIVQPPVSMPLFVASHTASPSLSSFTNTKIAATKGGIPVHLAGNGDLDAKRKLDDLGASVDDLETKKRMLQGLVQMGPKPDRFRAMNPDYESPYVNKQDALVRLGCYQSLGGPPETESEKITKDADKLVQKLEALEKALAEAAKKWINEGMYREDLAALERYAYSDERAEVDVIKSQLAAITPQLTPPPSAVSLPLQLTQPLRVNQGTFANAPRTIPGFSEPTSSIAVANSFPLAQYSPVLPARTAPFMSSPSPTSSTVPFVSPASQQTVSKQPYGFSTPPGTAIRPLATNMIPTMTTPFPQKSTIPANIPPTQTVTQQYSANSQRPFLVQQPAPQNPPFPNPQSSKVQPKSQFLQVQTKPVS